MIPTPSYKNLIVWQKSVALAGKVYAATRQLPSDERVALGQELLCAAVAVASSIAEGSGRSRTDFAQLLCVARRSLAQVETLVTIAADQGLIDGRDGLLEEIAAIGPLLTCLIRSLAAESRSAHARACLPAATAARPPRPPRTHT